MDKDKTMGKFGIIVAAGALAFAGGVAYTGHRIADTLDQTHTARIALDQAAEQRKELRQKNKTLEQILKVRAKKDQMRLSDQSYALYKHMQTFLEHQYVASEEKFCGFTVDVATYLRKDGRPAKDITDYNNTFLGKCKMFTKVIANATEMLGHQDALMKKNNHYHIPAPVVVTTNDHYVDALEFIRRTAQHGISYLKSVVSHTGQKSDMFSRMIGVRAQLILENRQSTEQSASQLQDLFRTVNHFYKGDA